MQRRNLIDLDLMVDAGIPQAHREVPGPLAGRHHEPPLQPLELHVPQPRRVVTVRDPGVDTYDDRVRLSCQEIQELGPPCWVLGQ